MSKTQADAADPVWGSLDGLLADLESLYKDVHAHPELSMQEVRTAALAADRLRAAGFEVTTGVGGTGVVGVLRNGEGPTVMLRADMDALPVQEATGLPYASRATATDRNGQTVPVSHMCGHDMHVTWLAGATQLLAQARASWRGTLLAVFQPGEETAEGARAMLDDGLQKRFPRPDVVLGQHVMVGPAGTVAGRAGAITSAADSLQIRLFGRGAHGSMPQASVDPVVMAAATVMRLQGIVSREVAAAEAAVVTVGALQAGTKENVIPDEALIKLNVRTFDEGVRQRVLAAIERIVNAEAQASGAPRKPEITPLDRYPLNVNDAAASARLAEAFRAHFGAERVRQTGPAPASEDFGSFGTDWHSPSVFWFVGGTDPQLYAQAQAANRVHELPVNHSPKFAPVLHPTLRTGVETMVVAARAWMPA
ncbi:amidohydrolase [Ramlibacter tataouinensis]|uniref:amidohydrolase n=1 Tax=Ramlibacter tataouinensis TaxID=94132 RepID=UPI0022F40096|nr:amidohydrolase [Ramlibacter tataouinensis]WBY01124.1 amidohydrolase [Ramlibacter tataouinensis]